MIIHGIERVESLGKEKDTKHTYLRERLHAKGISDVGDLLAGLKVNPKESFNEVLEMVLTQLANRIRKANIETSLFKEVSFGPYQLELDPIQEIPKDVIRILSDFSKSKERNSDEIISILFTHRDGEITQGYCYLHGSITRKKHHTRWRLRNSPDKKHFFTVGDLPRWIATTFLYNSVWRFAKENRDLVRRVFVQNYLHRKNVNRLPLTGVDEIEQKFLEEVMAYQFKKGIRRNNNSTPSDELFAEDERELYSALISDRPHYWDQVNNLLFRTSLNVFLREIKLLQYEAEARDESISTHARVWQLKKNIPLRTLDAMNTSVFLQTYKTVEFDADVDLEKVRDIEKEFLRFLTILPIPKSDGSFRIRKLGKYRAAGLYFPFHKATCIDIDGISAFAHELLHQLDFTLLGSRQRLSETVDFRDVYDAYERVVLDEIGQLPKGDPFLATWCGRTKYNSDYYLQETEVFARCGELYLYHCVGVRSSFLKESYDRIVYPKDPNLLEVIFQYYSSLFPQKEVSYPQVIQPQTLVVGEQLTLWN